MAFMEWTDQYSTGVAVFDDEHRKLIGIINDLHDGIMAGVDNLALQRISDRLVDYTLTHFRHEEEHFDASGYPETKQHIASHAALRRQVFEYRKQIRAKESSKLAAEMLEFLKGWLARHILEDDKRFGDYLVARGVRVTAHPGL